MFYFFMEHWELFYGAQFEKLWSWKNFYLLSFISHADILKVVFATTLAIQICLKSKYVFSLETLFVCT